MQGGDTQARLDLTELIMRLNLAMSVAREADDWSLVDEKLKEVFSSNSRAPHLYIAALHVTLCERDRLTTWYSFRDYLMANSTPDIKKLLTGL